MRNGGTDGGDESVQVGFRGAEVSARGRNTFQITVVLALVGIVVLMILSLRSVLKIMDDNHASAMGRLVTTVSISQEARGREHMEMRELITRDLGAQSLDLADRVGAHDATMQKQLAGVEREIERNCRPRERLRMGGGLGGKNDEQGGTHGIITGAIGAASLRDPFSNRH